MKFLLSIDSTLEMSRKVWKGLFLYLIKDRLCLPSVDGRTICISQQEDVILVPSSRQIVKLEEGVIILILVRIIRSIEEDLREK